MINVPIADVVNPSSMLVTVTDPVASSPAMMQIYTGTVPFIFTRTEASGDPTLADEKVRSFLPLDGNFNLTDYPMAPTAITVVASLTSFDVEDTTFIGAINTAVITVENHRFKIGAALVPVLVMSADAAVRNGGVGRIAYQVTVLSSFRDLGVVPFQVPPNSHP